MTEWMLLPHGVTKTIVYGGKGNLPDFCDGGKILFHYRTHVMKGDGEKKLLDDSKTDDTPFEMLLGKKFKLDIWETLVKTMRLNEIAEFVCETRHVSSYPVVSKSLRDMKKKKSHHHDHHDHTHQCGFAAFSKGLGYKDLNEYIHDPKPLMFQIELLKVERPGDFEQDLWSLSLEEKLAMIPRWKEDGNNLYKSGDFDGASKTYSKALGSLEQLISREKPGSEEWLCIDNMKIALLLNFSQCMIAKKEYYQAIEHLTTVLEKDRTNVKALFRRGSAYHSVFNFTEARRDYEKARELDSSLKNTVDRELKKIQIDEKEKEKEDREKFKNAFKS